MRLTPRLLILARTALSMTQADVAKASGVSCNYIGMIEREERPISDAMQWKLRQALPLDDDAMLALLDADAKARKSRAAG